VSGDPSARWRLGVLDFGAVLCQLGSTFAVREVLEPYLPGLRGDD
jgi:hypothetical protein